MKFPESFPLFVDGMDQILPFLGPIFLEEHHHHHHWSSSSSFHHRTFWKETLILSPRMKSLNKIGVGIVEAFTPRPTSVLVYRCRYRPQCERPIRILKFHLRLRCFWNPIKAQPYAKLRFLVVKLTFYCLEPFWNRALGWQRSSRADRFLGLVSPDGWQLKKLRWTTVGGKKLFLPG